MVRSIIAADLLISDKSSVSSCVSVFVLTLIDFHSAILSLDQLVDESGELCLVVQDLPSLHWEGTGIPIQGGRLGR